MGFGFLATRLLWPKPSARQFISPIVTRAVSSTPELHKPEASAATEKPVDLPPPLPPRTPMGGARVNIASPEDAIEVFVDGYPVKILKGFSVLQACEVAGVDIPRFYYHNRLSTTENCRICLVEVQKSPKPVVEMYFLNDNTTVASLYKYLVF